MPFLLMLMLTLMAMFLFLLLLLMFPSLLSHRPRAVDPDSQLTQSSRRGASVGEDSQA